MAISLTDILLLGKSTAAIDEGTLLIFRRKTLEWAAVGHAVDIVVSGVAPLSLPDAVANGLKYVKAFGGTEARNVPEGYQELEYIQGQSNVQYINTNIVPNSSMEMYYKGQFVSTTVENEGDTFFGVRSVNEAGQGIFTRISSTSFDFDWFSANDRYTVSTTRNNGDFVEFNIKNSLLTITKNGTVVGTNQFTPTGTTTDTLWINALNNLGTPGGTISSTNRIYHFTIAGICDMIPAKRLVDNAIGMWDKVRKQFFTNAGTGTFTAGNAVTAPTPARPLDIWCNNGAVKAIRPIEYLESTGTQYIDLGMKVTSSDVIDMKVAWTTTETNRTIFASKEDANFLNGKYLGITFYGNAGNKAFYNRGSTTSSAGNTATQFTTTAGVINTIHWQPNINSIVFNGTTYTGASGCNSQTTATFTTANNPYIFAVNQAGTAAQFDKARLYSFQIHNKDGVLIRDMIPALDSQNVPCMYDKVEGKCYYNAGTGQFVAPYLPADYQQVEFIRSTGTQYIDTGLQFAAYPFKKVITFSDVVQGSGASSLPNWVNGSWANDSNNRSGGIGLKTNSKIGLGIGTTGLGSSPYEIDNPTTPTTVTIEVLSSTSAKFTGGSVDYDSITYSGGALSGYTDYLFGAHYNGTTSLWAAGVKIYRAEYYNNGVHVADMIPVKKISTGEYGMYDLIRQQWFGNAGSDAFTAGNEISSDTLYMIEGTVEKVGIHSADNKNLFNGVFEQGGIYQGNRVNANTRIRTPNPFSLAAGTYTVSCASDYEIWVEINGASGVTWEATKTITVSATDKIMIAVRNKTNPSTTLISPDEAVNVQIESGSTATAYNPYYDGGLATCENLFGIGTTQDVQELLAGDVTSKFGVFFLTGDESWERLNFDDKNIYRTSVAIPTDRYSNPGNNTGVCSHFTVIPNSSGITSALHNLQLGWNTNGQMHIRYDDATTLASFQTWLQTQYNAGTPVTLIYPLASEVSESVAGQTLTIAAGDNTAEIKEASIDGLSLEVKYTKNV